MQTLKTNYENDQIFFRHVLALHNEFMETYHVVCWDVWLRLYIHSRAVNRMGINFIRQRNSLKVNLAHFNLKLLRPFVSNNRLHFVWRPRNDEYSAGTGKYFQLPGVFVIARFADEEVQLKGLQSANRSKLKLVNPIYYLLLFIELISSPKTSS